MSTTRAHGRSPILVTGVPRSGTTWLARLLAQGPGMALAGREPMNPRDGQYALARTLDGWARVIEPTGKQRRALKLVYQGLNPLAYSRYGHRQWAAPWPGTRLVIKDPFALLSIPGVVHATGAHAVVVYRHAGAVLASYQRMGWSPDLDELRRVVEQLPDTSGLPEIPRPGEADPAEAMGIFWSVLHEIALADVAADPTVGPRVHVISHQELAGGGPAAGRAVAQALGITWNDAMEAELSKESSASGSSTSLHNFDRAPAEVAEAWRAKVTPAEIEAIERVADATWHKLTKARLRLTEEKTA